MAYDPVMALRVPVETQERVKRLASQEGVSTSEWVRRALDAALGRVRVDPEERFVALEDQAEGLERRLSRLEEMAGF